MATITVNWSKPDSSSKAVDRATEQKTRDDAQARLFYPPSGDSYTLNSIPTGTVRRTTSGSGWKFQAFNGSTWDDITLDAAAALLAQSITSGRLAAQGGQSAGTAPTFTLALTGYALTNYVPFAVKFHAAATAAATLNINSTGAKSLYRNGAAVSSTNPIVSGDIYIGFYDGTQFQLISRKTISNDLATTIISGLTDIGAALADADLLMVDDGGSGTTLRKTALSRIWTYIHSKLSGDKGDITFGGTAPALTATIDNDVVSNAKLRNSAGLSVIGRSANSSGDPDDIVASSDELVLRRAGTSIGFGQIKSGGIEDKAVTLAKVDVNGGTDIGADLADDDELVVYDKSATGNRKSAFSRIATYILSKLAAMTNAALQFSANNPSSTYNIIKFIDTDTSSAANQIIGQIHAKTMDSGNNSEGYIQAREVGTSGGVYWAIGGRTSGTGAGSDIARFKATGVELDVPLNLPAKTSALTNDGTKPATEAQVLAAIEALEDETVVKATRSTTSTTDGNDTISLTGLGITTNDSASVNLWNYRTTGSGSAQALLDLRFNGVSTSTYYNNLYQVGSADTRRRIVANFDRGQTLILTMRIWRNAFVWNFEGTVSYRNSSSWNEESFSGSWESTDTIDTIAFSTPSSETTLAAADLAVRKHSPAIW